MRKTRTITALAMLAGLAAGCGPTLSTQTRLEVARPPGTSDSISKDGLVIDSPLMKEMPSQFVVRATACGADGNPLKDPMTSEVVTKDVTVLPKGFEFYQLKIRNDTDHVIRLQGAVIRLFDPGENQIEPQGKDDIVAATMRDFADLGVCAGEMAKVQGALATLKLIGQNTELLPGTTTSGFLFFQPPDSAVPGTWKLSLYEIPVKVDASGNVVGKTRFDFPNVRKKFQDTYSQSLAGPKTLVSTKEVQ